MKNETEYYRCYICAHVSLGENLEKHFKSAHPETWAKLTVEIEEFERLAHDELEAAFQAALDEMKAKGQAVEEKGRLKLTAKAKKYIERHVELKADQIRASRRAFSASKSNLLN